MAETASQLAFFSVLSRAQPSRQLLQQANLARGGSANIGSVSQAVVCGVEAGERLAALLMCEQMGANMCERECQRCSLTGFNTSRHWHTAQCAE